MRLTAYHDAPLPAEPAAAPATWFDAVLICVFIVGLYTHYTPQITATIPFPSAPAGIAGLIMLWRQRSHITTAAFATLVSVLLLYLLSILCATNLSFLGRRFNGFVQLSYSVLIGYGLFLTAARSSRRRVAGIFLGFSLIILVGCLLEDYTGLRTFSDHVREQLYSSGIYDSDLRDELLYGRVRPKFFASEPASVTFIYALCCFIWMAASRWRWKSLFYLALLGLGAFAMPGPTLILMLLLPLPYAVFVASPEGEHGRAGLDLARLVRVACLAAVTLGAALFMVNSIYSARLNQVAAGNDASFFYRVRGPALAARYVIEHYPIAGAGITGEPFIEDEVVNEYLRSPAYSRDWPIVHPSTELVINYFFLHWIYLGLVWGTIMLVAVTMWLKAIGVPSVAFCWLVWAILGQASGAYVGPLAWAVLYLAGAASLVYGQFQPATLSYPGAAASRTGWTPNWRRA
ncbi:MAG TPA: hypothetical protein VET85_01860 [Stellaceae bacterium]|nr:hypothetical protein [Stellaceae bacterium]